MEEEMEFEGIEEKMEAMMEVKDQMFQKANIIQVRLKRDTKETMIRRES